MHVLRRTGLCAVKLQELGGYLQTMERETRHTLGHCQGPKKHMPECHLHQSQNHITTSVKAKKASLYRFPKTRKAHYALYALYAILLTSGCSPASIRSVGVFFCDAFLCSFHSDIISSLTPLLHANKA